MGFEIGGSAVVDPRVQRALQKLKDLGHRALNDNRVETAAEARQILDASGDDQVTSASDAPKLDLPQNQFALVNAAFARLDGYGVRSRENKPTRMSDTLAIFEQILTEGTLQEVKSLGYNRGFAGRIEHSGASFPIQWLPRGSKIWIGQRALDLAEVVRAGPPYMQKHSHLLTLLTGSSTKAPTPATTKDVSRNQLHTKLGDDGSGPETLDKLRAFQAMAGGTVHDAKDLPVPPYGPGDFRAKLNYENDIYDITVTNHEVSIDGISLAASELLHLSELRIDGKTPLQILSEVRERLSGDPG